MPEKFVLKLDPKNQEEKIEKSEFQESLETNSPKIAESVFGEVLIEAEKKRKIKKSQDKKSQPKKTPKTVSEPSSVPTDKEVLFDAAEKLSDMAKTIKVTKEDKEKGTVKIEIDLEKIPLGPDNKKLTAKDVLTPDVKSFSISINGEKEKVVERRDLDGNIDYYHEDEKGKITRLSLPEQGTATIRITPDDIDNKSKTEILEIMKKEARQQTKKQLKKHHQAIGNELEKPIHISSGGGGGGHSSSRGGSYSGGYSSPSYTPTSAPINYAEAIRQPEKISSSVGDEYKSHTEKIKQKLNPSKVSIIPETPSTKEIPAKPKGVIRMVVFGDTDAKSGKNTDQLHLKQLQAKCPEWQADFALGVGDYIYDRGNRTDKRYKELVKNAKEEFNEFGTLPFALALGNHDRNSGGTDHMLDLYKDKLPEFEGDKSAYSFVFGNATFVVFNEGSKSISKKQTEFFRKKSKEAPGAVYLINHVPPYQNAFGPGLPENGQSDLKNFKEIQKIAKENIEDKGQPFYILSGHTHFSNVIGNYLNPGGMGINYYGLNNKRLQSVKSAAVIDIDEKTGAINAVYFRTADSGFEDPLPETQNQLAWNTLESSAIKTVESPEEETLVSADFYVNKHPRSGTTERPYHYFQNTLSTSKGKIQISTSGRLGVTTDPYIKEVGNIPLAIKQARKLKERGIEAIVSLSNHTATKRAANEVGLDYYRGHMSTTFGPSSIKLFNQIAKYLKEGKDVHVHCKHGTHRAKTALAGGLIAAGYAKSVGEAFSMVGLRYGSFKNQWSYIKSIIRFAKSKGVKVESPGEIGRKYGVKGSGLTYYERSYQAAKS
jgi:hypothetical protein